MHFDVTSSGLAKMNAPAAVVCPAQTQTQTQTHSVSHTSIASKNLTPPAVYYP